MRHFPVFLDLRGRLVVVAGCGTVAASKLRLLLKTDARIHVFGDQAGADVRRWHARGFLTWHPRELCQRDLDGTALVYAASEDAEYNRRTVGMAREAGVFVNVVDDLEASEFITPAIVDRDPVTVAIGTEGTAPVLARRIKAQIEDMLSPRLGALARAASRARQLVRHHPRGPWRRRFWSDLFSPDGERLFLHDGEAGIARLLNSHLRGRANSDVEGRVLLVGAGPGDPEMLTLKARRVLREADVVLFDRLVDPAIVELARREAVLVEVGKTSAARLETGDRNWEQPAINRFMVEQARAGHTVVRLKSGDPMVFGRADEEIDALEAAGIACEVVAGITSAVAAAASMRTSLTRRGRNSGFTFITAQDSAGYAEHDWRALARPGAAFAIYMGVRAARFVQGRLLLHGASPGTPVSVVENASREDERVLVSTLHDLDALFQDSGVAGPALIFVGLRAREENLWARRSRVSPDAPVPTDRMALSTMDDGLSQEVAV